MSFVPFSFSKKMLNARQDWGEYFGEAQFKNSMPFILLSKMGKKIRAENCEMFCFILFWFQRNNNLA